MNKVLCYVLCVLFATFSVTAWAAGGPKNSKTDEMSGYFYAENPSVAIVSGNFNLNKWRLNGPEGSNVPSSDAQISVKVNHPSGRGLLVDAVFSVGPPSFSADVKPSLQSAYLDLPYKCVLNQADSRWICGEFLVEWIGLDVDLIGKPYPQEYEDGCEVVTDHFNPKTRQAASSVLFVLIDERSGDELFAGILSGGQGSITRTKITTHTDVSGCP